MTALPQLKSMTCEIAISGVAATLDLSGAMYCPDHDALVVADLHFEKGSSFARRGQLLPPYDTRETMAPLAAAVERYRPATVIALGDSFHDLDGPERHVADDRAALARLQHGRRWIWITGNHDRALPPSIGGEVVEELALGAYAGGLNACDPAIRRLFPKGFTAHLIGEGRIFAIAQAMLCRD